jgi:hypothetical protein
MTSPSHIFALGFFMTQYDFLVNDVHLYAITPAAIARIYTLPVANPSKTSPTDLKENF